MNHTRTLTVIAAAFTLAFLATPAAHANTASEGVKCPSGTTAKLSNNDRKLVCEFEERIERASVCSPLVFKNNGDINLNQRIDLIEAGSDTCKAISTGAVAPSQALLLPGDDASQFRREVRPGKDVFVRVKLSHKFPQGGPIYVGDASKGVSCPSGFDGDAKFGGQGMRCDRREYRKAVCDAGWSMDRNNGTDKCYIEKEVFGNKVRVDGQFTIPDVFLSTGLTGNPETHGWDLKRDHDGQVDYWAKEAKDYRFPQSN